nr:MAG TPA: hypothetical protein [Caudoviricetes sp.]
MINLQILRKIYDLFKSILRRRTKSLFILYPLCKVTLYSALKSTVKGRYIFLKR